jgi:hypothetical protein
VWKIRSRYVAGNGAAAIRVLVAPGSERFDDCTTAAWRVAQVPAAALLAVVPALAILEKREVRPPQFFALACELGALPCRQKRRLAVGEILQPPGIRDRRADEFR